MDCGEENVVTFGKAFRAERRGLLAALSSGSRIAFAASVCERLYAVYCAFYQQAKWGDPSALRRSIDFAWTHIGSTKSDPALVVVNEFEEMAPRIIPNSDDDHSSFLVTEAQCAGLATSALLKCCLDGSVDSADIVGEQGTDCIYFYLHSMNDLIVSDVTNDDWLLQVPLWKGEVHKQRLDLALLAGSDDPSAVIDALKTRGSLGILPRDRGFIL